MGFLFVTTMNGYLLTKRWFEFCSDNPEKIKPIHTAVYFFAIEQCNRLGWKSKFSFPSIVAMNILGIHSYNTYIKSLRDLIEWGFIEMVQESKNQYSCNVIALSNFDKAHDKADTEHVTKQVQSTSESTVQSTSQSTDSIYINNINNINSETSKPTKPINHLLLDDDSVMRMFTEPEPKPDPPDTKYSDDFERVWEMYGRKGSKRQAYIEWIKLAPNDRKLTLSHIPAYVDNLKDEPQFMKDFERYLKHGTYHSTIIERPRKNYFSGSL